MILAIILLIVCDLPWLFLTRSWAGGMIQRVQSAPIQLRWIPAFLVYVVGANLLSYAKNGEDAFWLGFLTYALYEMTNLATLKAWDWKFSVADSLWGGVLFWIVYSLIKFFTIR